MNFSYFKKYDEQLSSSFKIFIFVHGMQDEEVHQL